MYISVTDIEFIKDLIIATVLLYAVAYIFATMFPDFWDKLADNL